MDSQALKSQSVWLSFELYKYALPFLDMLLLARYANLEAVQLSKRCHVIFNEQAGGGGGAEAAASSGVILFSQLTTHTHVNTTAGRQGRQSRQIHIHNNNIMATTAARARSSVSGED